MKDNNEIKSFLLYRKVIPPPARFVEDYTPEEIGAFQRELQPQLTEYRKHAQKRSCLGFTFVAGIFLLFALLPSKKSPAWIEAPDAICWILGILLTAILITLIALAKEPPCCPACNHDVKEARKYCPECGANGLIPATFFRSPRCTCCGKSMDRGKGGPHYQSRFCTHCGIPLDKDGV